MNETLTKFSSSEVFIGQRISANKLVIRSGQEERVLEIINGLIGLS